MFSLAAQSQDSEASQCNLEIGQFLRLHKASILVSYMVYMYMMSEGSSMPVSVILSLLELLIKLMAATVH